MNGLSSLLWAVECWWPGGKQGRLVLLMSLVLVVLGALLIGVDVVDACGTAHLAPSGD